ncbi:related to regulator of ATP-sensitive K+ channels Alpha-endosulfine/ARPP-19 and related cAMP-regulated phosphoproteins [Cephalotrichum gorgonifer]|uniref:mRNA stability protein n=1 Tax=Cephalotrichum gorgonifer TaxID=2041049 RepID=A0AAE8N882_9PEZI|nr:related to regulator of ATP-sensitive K+ channels Alpha-endosulfine/ARPP-19 and related cAMP-regulated phosphoproteins [Cephalotrichum gorgonifer]
MLNPHQKNKVDVKSLSPEEQRLFRLYGKLPSRSDHFSKHLKERKYFDSGDYALSKAGKADSVDTGAVGSEHPVPENIPHLTSPGGNSGSNGGAVGGGPIQGQAGRLSVSGLPHAGLQAGSPVKESSFLTRETSAEDVDEKADEREVSLPVRG